MEKENLTQQKHTLTNQNECTTTQNKHKKTKARFSRLLRHPAWKLRGPIISALRKFLTYLLRHLPTYLWYARSSCLQAGCSSGRL